MKLYTVWIWNDMDISYIHIYLHDYIMSFQRWDLQFERPKC